MRKTIEWFENDHLKDGTVMKQVSDQFKNFANYLNDFLPEGPEKSTALRKLLESKDSAVRSAVEFVEDNWDALDGTPPSK